MAGEGYIGAGGEKFMSSVLAKASLPGGYTRTTYWPGGNPYYTGPKRAAGGSLSAAAQLAFNKSLNQYAPGGAYGKGVESALERGRTKAVASGQQSLVSAGLAGTSLMAAPGQRFEEEVAMPTRAKVEETRAGRLSEIYAMMANMQQQAFESEQERNLRSLSMSQPNYSMPTIAPATTSDYMSNNASTSVSNIASKIASAMGRVGLSPSSEMFRNKVVGGSRFDVDFS